MLKYFLVIIFTCVHYTLIAQVNFLNPSFEDSTASGFSVPPDWTICVGSPDIQSYPGWPGISPSEGNTYMGLAVFQASYEAIEQKLLDNVNSRIVKKIKD